jgi:hypothetical protein
MPTASPLYRWKFHDPMLLSLFPITYVLHLTEEWFAPVPIVHWAARAERPLDPAVFIIANGIGLSLMLNGIWLAQRMTRFRWIVPALATAVLLNTFGHLVGSVSMGGYSAGLVTASIFWIPLGMLTLMRVWDQATRRTLVAGLIVGFAIEIIVVVTLPLISAARSSF